MAVNWRGALVYVLILVVAGALILGVFPTTEKLDETPISQVVADINDGKIESVTVDDGSLTVAYMGGTEVASHKEEAAELTESLLALGVNPEALPSILDCV